MSETRADCSISKTRDLAILCVGLVATLLLSMAWATGKQDDFDFWFVDQVTSYEYEQRSKNYFPWQEENLSPNEAFVSSSCGLYKIEFLSTERIQKRSLKGCATECGTFFLLADEFCRPPVNFNHKNMVLMTRNYTGKDYLLDSFYVHLDSDDRFYISAKKVLGVLEKSDVKVIPKPKQECIDFEYLSKIELEFLERHYMVEKNSSSICFSEGVYID